MIRSRFQAPGLLLCFILFFSACDFSKKNHTGITEKRAISIIDSLLLINEAKDSYSVPTPNSNTSLFRMVGNNDNYRLCNDTIVCANGDTTVIQRHCLPDPPPSVTHNVTGEIGNLFAYSTTNAYMESGSGAINKSCFPYTGEEITVYGNISIEIPANMLDDQDINPITCRISILKDAEILDENNYTIKEIKIGDLPRIYTNDFSLYRSAYSPKCIGDSVVFANISLAVSFIPNLPISSLSRPIYRFGFQALDGTDSIVHSGYDHTSPLKKVTISSNQLNQTFDGTVSVTRTLICPDNPESLEDFLRISNYSECGHQANHTLLLKIPFCSLEQINVKDITVESDPIIAD